MVNKKSMIYGYARCSTDETRQDISRQERELKTMGAEHIYWEYESGTKTEREELRKLMAAVRPGDTIAVTEMSRLSRSIRQLSEIADFVTDNKLQLIIGTLVIDCTTGKPNAMTAGMLHMMAVFSQLERSLTVERVKSGLRNAKAKGTVLGRPRTQKKDIPKKFVDAYQLYLQGRICKSDIARLCGISRTTVYKWISVINDDL